MARSPRRLGSRRSSRTVRDHPEVLVEHQLVAVADRHPGRLLATMLEREQAERRRSRPRPSARRRAGPHRTRRTWPALPAQGAAEAVLPGMTQIRDRDLERVGDAAAAFLGRAGRPGPGQLDRPAGRRRPCRCASTGSPCCRASSSSAGANRGRQSSRRSATGSRRTGPRPASSRPRAGCSAPRPPHIAPSARATARPPPETSCAEATRPRAIASRMNAWSAASRARSRAGGPSSAAAPASAGVGATRPARASPRRRGGSCRAPRTNAGPTSVATSSSSPTTPISGVGAIEPAGRLVVERHVAAGDGQAERPARIGEAADALGQLPERLGTGRIAVVQAVRHAERAGPGDRHVARRLGDGQGRAEPRIERRRRPGCRPSVATRRLRRALHAQDRGAVAGPGDRVRADRRVVLVEDRVARGEVRASPRSASRTAPGSMPRSGRRSGASIGRPRRRRGAVVGRRAGHPLVDDGIAGQRRGRDPGDLAGAGVRAPSASSPPSTIDDVAVRR